LRLCLRWKTGISSENEAESCEKRNTSDGQVTSGTGCSPQTSPIFLLLASGAGLWVTPVRLAGFERGEEKTRCLCMAFLRKILEMPPHTVVHQDVAGNLLCCRFILSLEPVQRGRKDTFVTQDMPDIGCNLFQVRYTGWFLAGRDFTLPLELRCSAGHGCCFNCSCCLAGWVQDLRSPASVRLQPFSLKPGVSPWFAWRPARSPPLWHCRLGWNVGGGWEAVGRGLTAQFTAFHACTAFYYLLTCRRAGLLVPRDFLSG
jgi:hypothetical protein